MFIAQPSQLNSPNFASENLKKLEKDRGRERELAQFHIRAGWDIDVVWCVQCNTIAA